MHLTLLLSAIAIALILRCCVSHNYRDLHALPWVTLMLVVPGLLLVVTSIALVWMGPSGTMVQHWEGPLVYGIAVAFLTWAIAQLVWLAGQGWRSLHHVRQYQRSNLHGYPCRIVDLPLPYSAQIGFWQPELVISQSLLHTLDDLHLQAVLAHEDGHRHYRDTFWMFVVGWLRRLVPLPHTQLLWNDLLLLREMRADWWAAQQVDHLVLAEALIDVAKAPGLFPSPITAEFMVPMMGDRLTTRIEALLTHSPLKEPSPFSLTPREYVILCILVLPLLVIPFHV